jgi:hypothetical protein
MPSCSQRYGRTSGTFGSKNACRAARLLGFVHEGGRGSHRVFKRKGERMQLNFQNRNGYIPPYQARQLARMIDKYGPGV